MFAGAGVAGHLALIFLSLALWWALGDALRQPGLVGPGRRPALGRRGRRHGGHGPHPDEARDPARAAHRRHHQGHPRGTERTRDTMTTTNDPDAIRAEIDRTRGRLSEDVDVLTESVRPSSVAKRTAQRATGRAGRLKENVMGTAHDTTSAGADTAHDVAEGVKEVPDLARRQARGNPLAAGAVALAAGWLVGSLLPASSKERELASTAKDKAAAARRRGEVGGAGDGRSTSRSRPSRRPSRSRRPRSRVSSTSGTTARPPSRASRRRRPARRRAARRRAPRRRAPRPRAARRAPARRRRLGFDAPSI